MPDADAERNVQDARKANKRGAARLAAVQALYQMDLAGTGVNEIMAEFESHWLGGEVEGAKYLPGRSPAYFRDIVSGVVREQMSLDPKIDAVLTRGWPLKRIEAVLRAVLRAGAYECLSQRRARPRGDVGICRCRRRFPSTRRRPAWSTLSSIKLARQFRVPLKLPAARLSRDV